MTTTRERLERRWTPGRVVLLVVGVVVALLVVASAVALWWLPPVLAETPRERLTAPTAVSVQDASGRAGVEVAAGWVPLGVGPFLPGDTATVLSPDGVYRAELGLAHLSGTDDSAIASALSALLVAHDLTDVPAGSDAASTTEGPASALRWSEETLISGITVRYADIVRGDTTFTVVLAFPQPGPPSTSEADGPTPTESLQSTPPAPGATPSPPAPGASASPFLALTLVAMTPTADATNYRTVTADLLASATFARAPMTSPSAVSSSGGAR